MGTNVTRLAVISSATLVAILLSTATYAAKPQPSTRVLGAPRSPATAQDTQRQAPLSITPLMLIDIDKLCNPEKHRNCRPKSVDSPPKSLHNRETTQGR